MKNFFKKALVLLVVITLAVPAVNGVEAKAASKPSLSTKKMKIGIGSYGLTEDGLFYHKTKTKYTLSVKNSNKKATYTFKSSNKKVATVKAKGTKGYITGVKAGKATITVKQKLSGKTTTVGKCTVTVKKSTVTAIDSGVTVGNGTLICWIDNYNPAAKYTYECDDSNFKATDKREEEGDGYYSYGQEYTAKKTGTYTVTLKETYKKKTRTVGTFKVEVLAGSVEENVTLYMGQEEWLDYYIYNYGSEGYWYELDEDSDILQDMDGGCVKAVAEGTTTIDVWHYDAVKEDKGEFIGTITVTVIEDPYEETEEDW